jgi:hypothetical protein
MQGLKFFGLKVKKNPPTAVFGLFIDYFVFIGIVIFFILLMILKWPLLLIDSITGLRSREGFVDLIGKIADA